LPTKSKNQGGGASEGAPKKRVPRKGLELWIALNVGSAVGRKRGTLKKDGGGKKFARKLTVTERGRKAKAS